MSNGVTGIDESDDEFINIDEVDDNLHDFFQVQINNTELKMVQIGRCSKIPDIVIKKDFGKGSAFSLYNTVYSREELEKMETFIPIVRLVQKFTDVSMTYCIAVKLNGMINSYTDFEVYFLRVIDGKNGVKGFEKKLEKNVGVDNMVKTLLENVIDLNVEILDRNTDEQ